jgi:small subunit ribosomal protein S6
MNKYEHVFIARPDVSPAQMESSIEELKALIEEKGGKVHKTEYWGLRTLAYRVNKNRKGHYGYLDMEAGNEVLDAHRLTSSATPTTSCAHMTCRVDELNEEPSAVLRKGEDRKRRERRSPPQGLPLLGRERAEDRLQGHQAPAALHFRARQDRAVAHHRRVGQEAA